MLLVCIRSFLKLVLRYKFLILNTYHPDTLHVREQGREDPRLHDEAKRVREHQQDMETMLYTGVLISP